MRITFPHVTKGFIITIGENTLSEALTWSPPISRDGTAQLELAYVHPADAVPYIRKLVKHAWKGVPPEKLHYAIRVSYADVSEEVFLLNISPIPWNALEGMWGTI